VHAAVKRLAQPSEVATAVEPPAPAVSIRKSVTPDYLICLDDGRRFKSLRRHLATLGMTPEQYRAKWDLPSTYPMVAPNYAAQRSALAKSLGLGQLRQRSIATVPPSVGAPEVAAAPLPSPVKIETAAVPPAIDAAANGAAGAASRGKSKAKSKTAASPEPTTKRKSGRARKAKA
jgi:predicted transcriptional regulator